MQKKIQTKTKQSILAGHLRALISPLYYGVNRQGLHIWRYTMKTYSEKLKDPRWQKKRLEILNRDNFTCQLCDDTTTTLHVHHRRYLQKKDPWQYDNKFLVTMCATCHENEKQIMDEVLHDLNEILKEKFFGEELRGLVAGFHCLELNHLPDVVSRMIYFLLSDPVEMDELKERYFTYLRGKNG